MDIYVCNVHGQSYVHAKAEQMSQTQKPLEPRDSKFNDESQLGNDFPEIGKGPHCEIAHPSS